MRQALIIIFGLMVCSLYAQNFGTIGMPGGSLQGGEMDSIVHKVNVLGSNVNLVSNSVYYDGPSVAIDSGAWLIVASGYYVKSPDAGNTAEGYWVQRITDKTTHYSSSSNYFPTVVGAIAANTVTSTAFVNTTTAKTIYLQGACSTAINAVISSSGNATRITAIKLSGY